MAPLAPTIHEDVAAVARAAGYSRTELLAAFMFFRRKNRIDQPPGRYDRAGRLQAARTARHCAEVVGEGAVVLHVKRIAKAMEASRDGADRTKLEKILKPVTPATALEVAG
jgi:hypothetical protein